MYNEITKGKEDMENHIKELRKKRDMTLAELSKKSGVSVATIRSYEYGYNDIGKAQLSIIVKLCTALCCKTTELVDII